MSLEDIIKTIGGALILLIPVLFLLALWTNIDTKLIIKILLSDIVVVFVIMIILSAYKNTYE